VDACGRRVAGEVSRAKGRGRSVAGEGSWAKGRGRRVVGEGSLDLGGQGLVDVAGDTKPLLAHARGGHVQLLDHAAAPARDDEEVRGGLALARDGGRLRFGHEPC